MIDALILISQRPIVITLAIIGALLVTAGALVTKPQPRAAAGSAKGAKNAKSNGQTKLSRSLTNLGYLVTMVSIALFIIAGFVSDLRP